MEIGELISLYRKQKNLTIDELAQLSGVPKGTINKIIGGVTKAPTLENVRAIAYALGKTLNDFDDPPHSTKKEAPSDLPEEALRIAKDYSQLDQPGKNVVKVVISEEGKRVQAEKLRRQAKELYTAVDEETGEPLEARVIPLYFTPAAAGYTSPAAGEDFEYIEVGGDVPRYADFAVKIDGDSMEPYIRDGSTVYVNRDPIVNGDVGIFFIDGDMVCKQYYRDERGNVRLLSLNRNRSDADRFVWAGDSDTVMTCYGRVILPQRPKISLL